jgi:type III secretion protein T
MNFGPIAPDDVVRLAGHWMLAYGIAMARPLAVLTISPLFARAQISGFMRGAVATAFAVPALPLLGHTLNEFGSPAYMIVLLTIKEAVLGGLLGLLLGIPFLSLEVAGQIVDTQRGASSAQANDATGEEMSFSGTLFFLIGGLVFAASGGIQEAVALLYKSWQIWPALAGLPSAGSGTPVFVLGLMDQVLAEAFRLVSPLVFAMLLADIALILIGRVAPQLRVDNQALSVRNLVFFVALPIYGAYLLYYIREAMFQTPHALDLIGKVLPNHAPSVFQ